MLSFIGVILEADFLSFKTGSKFLFFLVEVVVGRAGDFDRHLFLLLGVGYATEWVVWLIGFLSRTGCCYLLGATSAAI